jgi:exopolyphosphatase/guanosine-5'-triphosphate,3'-diphosphate pyrophosphatase
MRVGAIDCGTNSIRLLVADVDGTHLDEVVREMTVVRLGEGVDRSGAFSEAALERTFAACDAYAVTLRDVGVERLRFVATSASRDVSNRAAFVDGVRARLGVEPEIISGAEEARLSFRGAVEGLPPERIAMPTLVVDIGGGSTEFVLGDRGADGRIEVEAAISVDIGCVRMTERHLHGDPPGPEEIARVEADVEAALDRAAAEVPLDRARSLAVRHTLESRDAVLTAAITGKVPSVREIGADPAAPEPERLPAWPLPPSLAGRRLGPQAGWIRRRFVGASLPVDAECRRADRPLPSAAA